MKTIIHGALALSVAVGLFACGTGGGDGETTTGSALSLSASRQGQTGGFVDFDGDGDEDKLVGAPYAKFGSKTGALLVYARGVNEYGAQPAQVLQGGDNFGFAFARVGDVDKDGFEDYAISALNGTGEGAQDPSLSGTVSVYRGGTGGKLLRKLAGETPLAKFGYAIAGGDLDNDGYSDVIVGAPFNTKEAALMNQGAVYVAYGPDLTRTSVLYATSANKGLGLSVEAGDITGDGVADLLISAQTAYPVVSAKVLGYYGGAGFAPSIGSPDLLVSNTISGFGSAMKVVGDLNGDGYGDLAIGAPKAAVAGASETGLLFLLKGSDGPRTIYLAADATSLLATIAGATSYSRFGYAIERVGDTLPGTKPNFAVSAPLENCPGKPMGGKVYYFTGEGITPTSTIANATSFDAVTRDQGYGAFLAATGEGYLMIGGPLAEGASGGVAMVNPASGSAVSGGSSGGATGVTGDCH